ncbi:hypothetical protein [Dyella sp.]|uniref:hypothetical protein n=1 Tax=Dyella sp. TaxID=1869338 RepID=UPI0028440237|nr:hypothetical protein [Dyella sp.]MDR3446586.1 hypothetical protein [Dyella sp.]
MSGGWRWRKIRLQSLLGFRQDIFTHALSKLQLPLPTDAVVASAEERAPCIIHEQISEQRLTAALWFGG